MQKSFTVVPCAKGSEISHRIPCFLEFSVLSTVHFAPEQASADPLPLYFAKINARGGGGLRGTLPQRSDPPPQGPQTVPTLAPSHDIASKRIFRILILISGFDTVVTMTQRLPVALIPEELLVSSVGNDVVNISCFDILSFLHALNAEGMCLEVTLAGLLPRSTIAAPCRRPHLLWVLWLVYLAVLLPVGHKGSAARVTAGCVRSGRHDAHASQGRPIFPK